MLRQAVSLFTYRKKSTAMMVALLSLAAFLILSIAPIFTAILDTTFDGFVEKSGRFQATFFDLSEAQVAELRATPIVREVGLMENYGNFPLAGTDAYVTAGHMDETAVSLGGLRLLQGRLPETAGEAAVEEHLLYLLPEGSGVGSRFSLETPDGVWEFCICGVLRNYTGFCSSPDVPLPGENDYLNILLSKGDTLGSEPKTAALLYLYTLNRMESPNGAIIRLSNDIGDIDVDHMTFNDETYGAYFPMMIYPVYTYRGLFTILVLTGTAVLLCIALTAHFRTFAPVARTMAQLGASRARRLGLLLLWAGILGLAGVLLGALWCAAFTLCMRAGLHLEIHPLAQWPQLLFLLIGVLLTAAGYFVFGLEGKKLFPALRRRTAEDEDLGASPSLCGPIAVSYLRKNGRRMAAVGLLVVMFVAMIFCTQYDQQVRGREIAEEIPNLYANASTGWALYLYGDFEISAPHNTYPRAAVDVFQGMPGVLGVEKGTDNRSLLIFPEGESAYYRRLAQMTAEPPIDHEMSEVPAIPKGLRATMSYTLYVLDAWSLPYFEAAYPDIDVERDLAPGKAVLFAKPLVMEGLETDAVYNDAFRVGDALRLAHLEADCTFEEVKEHPEKIRYCEETVTLSRCMDEVFALDRPYVVGSEGGEITVVITEETAKDMSYLNRLTRFIVYLTQDITPEQQEAVEWEFYHIAMMGQGGDIIDSADAKVYMQQLWSAIGVVYAVLGGVLGLFILVALVGILYGSLLQRQQMFGILRATGYRQSYLFRAVLAELSVYFAFIVAAMVAVTMLSVTEFAKQVVGQLLLTADYVRLAGQLGWIALGLGAAFMLLAYGVSRSVFRKNIASCIRFAE